jgi:hypothetical protein
MIMKKLVWGMSLLLAIFLGISWNSDKARAIDTVVVGQPYYGYGYAPYGGFYGASFFPGYYQNPNPVFQSIGGNPYFLTNAARRSGAITPGQARNAYRAIDNIYYAPLIGGGDPNAFTGPYVDYNDSVYVY